MLIYGALETSRITKKLENKQVKDRAKSDGTKNVRRDIREL